MARVGQDLPEELVGSMAGVPCSPTLSPGVCALSRWGGESYVRASTAVPAPGQG